MSDTSWLRTSPWVEHRMGERFPVREPMLSWRVSGNPIGDQQCRFLDVSRCGALLLAPAAADLQVDSEVLLGHEGEVTRVRISRIESYNSSFSFYGVEFIDFGFRFKQLIDSLTRPGRVETSA